MPLAGKHTQNDLARYAHVLTRVRGSLLDVGCGRGIFLDAYPGSDKAGVDIRPSGEHEWPFQVADADALPFADAAWDTVSAQEMLEHQADDKVGTVLAELRRVTRDRLILTVPFCERRLKSGHVQRFDAARLRAMFPTARFSILDKGDTSYPWVLIEEDRSGG
jgi:ubiquinone/menaquinone biosynthesis C-methylase UbiE